MDLLAARIGSTVHYDQPYTPTQKAKVERWFRTMKDQWMAGLDIKRRIGVSVPSASTT